MYTGSPRNSRIRNSRICNSRFFGWFQVLVIHDESLQFTFFLKQKIIKNTLFCADFNIIIHNGDLVPDSKTFLKGYESGESLLKNKV